MNNQISYDKIDQLPPSIQEGVGRMQEIIDDPRYDSSRIYIIAEEEDYKAYRGVLMKIADELLGVIERQHKLFTKKNKGQSHKDRLNTLIRDCPIAYYELDIVGLIAELRHVKLEEKTTHFEGLCPFHNEDTPSMRIDKAKGIRKCFGCGKGGKIGPNSLLRSIFSNNKKGYDQNETGYDQLRWMNELLNKYRISDPEKIQERKKELKYIDQHRQQVAHKQQPWLHKVTRETKKQSRHQKYRIEKEGIDELPF